MTPEEKIVALETARDNIYHQLDEIKKDLKDLQGLTLAIERLAGSVKTTGEKVDKIDNRLEAIEREPGDTFKHYKRLIIGCICTGIVGAIIGALLALVLR